MSDPIDVTDPALSRDAADRLCYADEPFTGETIESLPDFTTVEVISFVDGVREGGCWGWYPDGADRYSGGYAHGRPVGTWKHWAVDGQLIQEDEFDRSGGLHTRKRWDGTGALLADIDAAALAKPIRADAVDVDDEELESDPATGERRYRGAPFTGQTVEYFYPGGPIVQLTWYVDGFADGPDLSWHGDGARQFAGTAAAGRPIGLWLHWYPDGAPLRENVFNGNSVLMLRQEWDENGTRTGHTSDLPVPADDLVTFEAGDAELARDATTGRWDHRGEPFTGRLIERTGDAVETQDYRIGFPQGLFVRSEAGHVRRKGVRTPTGPIGAWYEWFPDGRIRQEDSYDLSHRLLLSRRFDELGVRIPASDKEDDAP